MEELQFLIHEGSLNINPYMIITKKLAHALASVSTNRDTLLQLLGFGLHVTLTFLRICSLQKVSLEDFLTAPLGLTVVGRRSVGPGQASVQSSAEVKVVLSLGIVRRFPHPGTFLGGINSSHG